VRSILKTNERLSVICNTKSYEPQFIACSAIVVSLLKAVFLDLGDTLVHLNCPWEDMFNANLQELYNYLTTKGLKRDFQRFSETFATQYDDASTRANLHKIEVPMEEIISDALNESGFRIPDTDLPTKAMIAFFGPEIEAWQVYPDTIKTLVALEESGYKMGVISNAKSDWAVHAILKGRNLAKFFETVVSSAAIKIRKPRPEIFTQALNALGVKPPDAVFVGDSMEADVEGSKKMGMRSIHLLRRPIEGYHPTNPDARVTSLSEAVKIITNWNNGYPD